MNTLIFDMDDTLVVEEASAEAAFRAACRYAEEKTGIAEDEVLVAIRNSCRSLWYDSPVHQYCLQVGIGSWEGLWAEFSGNDENLRYLADWAPTYRLASWHNAITRCGYEGTDHLSAELAGRFVEERRKLHIVYEDVVPALEQLRSDFRLALLTNGAPDLQRRKLVGSGLSAYFDDVFVSGEIGIGKPDKRIFEIVLDRLGTTAGSTAMIGNSLTSDIAPAIKVGMKTFWVNRGNRQVDSDITPHVEIHNLAVFREAFEQNND